MSTNDSYMPNTGGVRPDKYAYNPKTNRFEPVSYPHVNASPVVKSILQNGGTIIGRETKEDTSTSTGNINSTSQKKAVEEFLDVEYHTLSGEVKLVPSEKALSLIVGDTVQLIGFGYYLTGLYYITEKKVEISENSGMEITITVNKNGFGPSAKSDSTSVFAKKPAVIQKQSSTVARPAVVIKPTTSAFKVGDRVAFINPNAEYQYTNSSSGVRIPNWVKKKILTISQVSNDGSRILLKEVFSWTYSKNLKKV